MVESKFYSKWIHLTFIIFLGVITIGKSQEGSGTLRGNVYDRDFADPLANVRVTLLELNLSVTTTPEGRFIFQNLPVGKYTVTFTKEGYGQQMVSDVIISNGNLTDLREELSSDITEMEEVIVTAEDLIGGTEGALLDIRQETTSLTDSIGADLIKKAQAGTAAAALKVVVGTSVQDDKYVAIRGLADRYTGTLLNTVRVPTPDPDRRAVQLDMFPSSTIDSITVYKTTTPEIPGDFTGGGINIKSKSFPSKRVYSFSESTEYNTQTSLNNNFLSYKGGGVSTFAMDDGSRDLPSGVTKSAVSASVATDRTTLFSPVMGSTRPGAPGPNYSMSFSAGERFDLGEDEVVGFMAAAAYSKKYSFFEDGVNETYVLGGAGVAPVAADNKQYIETKGSEDVLAGVALTTSYQPSKDHEIGLSFIYNQTAKDQARLLQDTNSLAPLNVIIQNQSLIYTERNLTAIQLHGDHHLSDFHDIDVDWTAAYNLTSQNEPDVRFFRNALNTVTGVSGFDELDADHLLVEQNTSRIFRSIEEQNDQFMINTRIPFEQWDGEKGYVKFGPILDHTIRDYNQATFYYFSNGTPVKGQNGEFYSDIFGQPGDIGTGTDQVFLVHPNDLINDVDYNAKQLIEAGYAMVEFPLTSQFKVIGGARVERTHLSVDPHGKGGAASVAVPAVSANPIFLGVSDPAARISLRQMDLLPSVTLVYEVLSKLNLKMAWSETLARPTFRELAPVVTRSSLVGDAFVGNRGLQISDIDNYDFRAEWFRRSGEVIAVSFFYKEIKDPIEQWSFAVQSETYNQRINFPKGSLYGVEFEARENLDILSDWLKYFAVGVNSTFIQSRVVIPPEINGTENSGLSFYGLNSHTRPMFNQPSYLFNANLTYDNPDSGTSFGLFYNVTGDYLSQPGGFADGAKAIPDVYQTPIATINMSLEQRIFDNWKVTLGVKNLTDPTYETVYEIPGQGPVIHSLYRKGVDFSFKVSCSW